MLLLQDQLAEAQKQHQKVVEKLEKVKSEASQEQGRLREQLSKKATALTASQKTLADATTTANDVASVSD